VWLLSPKRAIWHGKNSASALTNGLNISCVYCGKGLVAWSNGGRMMERKDSGFQNISILKEQKPPLVEESIIEIEGKLDVCLVTCW
jgi:hypothetical protein